MKLWNVKATFSHALTVTESFKPRRVTLSHYFAVMDNERQAAIRRVVDHIVSKYHGVVWSNIDATEAEDSMVSMGARGR